MSHSRTLEHHLVRLVSNEERLGGRLTMTALAERCGVSHGRISQTVSGSVVLVMQQDESRMYANGRWQGLNVFYCRLRSAIGEQEHGCERYQGTAERGQERNGWPVD